jgi:hypothetical protein
MLWWVRPIEEHLVRSLKLRFQLLPQELRLHQGLLL